MGFATNGCGDVDGLFPAAGGGEAVVLAFQHEDETFELGGLTCDERLAVEVARWADFAEQEGDAGMARAVAMVRAAFPHAQPRDRAPLPAWLAALGVTAPSAL